jgi:Dolichyl-phosphate-mannose-protein mannosyltransferase
MAGLQRCAARPSPSGYRRAEQLTIGLLTLASAIFLTWSADLCLGGASLRHPPQPPHRWTISVSGSVLAREDELAVIRLFIDGRRAQAAELELKGDWQPGLDWPAPLKRQSPAQRSGFWKWWTDSPGWRARWNHRNSAKPASIAFSASSAAILFDRREHCGLLSISDETGRVWQDSCAHPGSPQRRYLAADLPAPMIASRWVFTTWLTAFLLLASAIRPWTDKRRLELWLIAYLAILQFLAWSTQDSGIVYDSLIEMPTIGQWVMGYPGYMPPGYPLLVAFGYLVSSTAGFVITFVQHVMIIASIWWCVRLVQRALGILAGFVVGLATGAAAPMLFLPQTLQSENVAIFGMAGALYFALRCRDRGRTADLLVSAILLAWGGMARIAPFVAVVPAVFLVMLDTKPMVTGLRRFGAITAVVAALVAVPIAWFGAKSGHMTLSSSVGHHLYDRVVSGQGLLDQTGPNTSRFIRLLAPLTANDATDIRLAPGRHPDFENILENTGLDYWDVEALMKGAAFEGIRQAPGAFIGFSLRQAWTQYLDDPTPMLSWWEVPLSYPKELESKPFFGVRANSLLWRLNLGEQFAVVWAFVPWLAIAGLAVIPMMRERLVLLAMAMIPLGYVLALGFLEVKVPRYTVAIIPFVFTLAAVPFAAIVTLIRLESVAAQQ